MPEQLPGAASEPQYRVLLEHFDALEQEFASLLTKFLNEGKVSNALVAGLLVHLPDQDTWRLIVSGDVVASVNSIESRGDDDSYTLTRGAGEVGARTIEADDGTYDIVIGAWSLMPAFEVTSPEELLEYMHRIAAHLAMHESGHAILHQRGEDSEAFQELSSGTKTERSWRKHLAAHIDDFRIEKMANRDAPAPMARSNGIGDAITHLREELNGSNALHLTDGEQATIRSSTAINDFIREMTYLAAEWAVLDGDVTTMRPDPLPEGWEQYVEEVWNMWILSLDRLKPADERMAVEDIAAVLTDLCGIVVLWSQRVVGYHFEMHDDGSWTANWLREAY